MRIEDEERIINVLKKTYSYWQNTPNTDKKMETINESL